MAAAHSILVGSSPAPFYNMTGGTVDTVAIGAEVWRVHTFTADSEVVVTAVGYTYPSVHLVLVGGGAGGSCQYTNGVFDLTVATGYGCGGGGGGGVLDTVVSPATLGGFAVTVGAGGAAGTAYTTNGKGADGGYTSVFSAVALGGGTGGGSPDTAGNPGGSGGGAGAQNGTPGAGTSGQGYIGGANGGFAGNAAASAGGGGAGAAGGASGSGVGGAGGAGKLVTVRGTNEYFGGGGGGSSLVLSTKGLGGIGGGGNGSAGGTYVVATAGASNTGGGGGGGAGRYSTDPAVRRDPVSFPGAAGGSGIAIISYRIA